MKIKKVMRLMDSQRSLIIKLLRMKSQGLRMRHKSPKGRSFKA
jgi:hypothetical protein